MTAEQLHRIANLVARWNLEAWITARRCACGESKSPSTALCESCDGRR